MNKDFLGASTQQLRNALQNTIRVFDEYRMNKKIYDAQAFKIYSTEEQVFNGDIVLTADVANRDIYKSVDGLSAVGIILRLAISIITVIMGLLVLMR